jgi:hypothetical protein
MSIFILGGPKRGKTTLAKMLAGTNGLEHRCTDPQRFCRFFIGTPDHLQYDEVSQWVADTWAGNPGLVVEGVHAASALLKYLQAQEAAGKGPLSFAPVTRVIYLPTEMGDASGSRHRAQTAYVEKRLAELLPRISSILETWEGDRQGGFKEIPRVALISHSPAVQRSKKVLRRH